MATQNIGLSLPPFNSPNWNTPLNVNFEIIDRVFGNTQTVATTSGGYLLKSTDLQNMRINVSGNIGTADTSIIFPDNIGGMWIVSNNTIGGGKVSLRTYSYTVTPIALPANESILVFSDGVNLYNPLTGYLTNYLPSAGGKISGNLEVAGTFQVAGDVTFADQTIYAPAKNAATGAVRCDGANVFGLYNAYQEAIAATLNLLTGKWTASGGLGIGPGDGSYEALAKACPQAVQREEGKITGDSPDVDVGVMLLSLLQQVQSLKAALAAVTAGKKT